MGTWGYFVGNLGGDQGELASGGELKPGDVFFVLGEGV